MPVEDNKDLSYLYDQAREIALRKTRQADLIGAESGYGSYCPSGIPIELAICLLLAGWSAAFAILYRAVTLKTAGRRKRFANEKSEEDVMEDKINDLFWWGMCIL